MAKNLLKICLFVVKMYERDRHTDRRTDRHRMMAKIGQYLPNYAQMKKGPLFLTHSVYTVVSATGDRR